MTDHFAQAEEQLEAARVARELVSQEYGLATGRRDYNKIGELNAAIKHCLAAAAVHAQLAEVGSCQPRPVIVIEQNDPRVAASLAVESARLLAGDA